MSGAPSLSYLSVVVPCRDESAAIEGVVRDALRHGGSVARRVEVIVVDDGSEDDSAARVDAIAREGAPVRVVRHAENRGYGAAVRSGFDAARGDHVLLIDGDGQFDLADLARVASALEGHDLVVGYRAPRRDAAHRVVNGLAWTWLTDTLLDVGVRDVNCAFKLVPRSLVARAALRSEGALVSAELISAARRLGLSIAEVPVRHLPRRTGQETGADMTVVVRAFRELFGLVARRLAEGAPQDVTIPR
jgi:glycosyltransferase involved in cell wall biosynthesis